jgi:dephospho-CoA kinase
MPRALRLGLTGGIGSGKSTVAAMLVGLGADLIDADAVSRATTGVGGSAIGKLVEAFGPPAVTSAGALDRDYMRDLVYTDPHAKKRLEAIIHPLVGEEIARQNKALVQAGSFCIVFDIPLLVESSRWRPNLDRILVVDCQVETQIRRVMARSHLARDAVKKIIASQSSRAERLRAADWVIFNDQISLAQLALEVAEVGQLAKMAQGLGLSSRQ